MRWYDSRAFKRFFEILPGAVSWTVLVLPVVVSLIQPVIVAYFIIAFDLYWSVKSFRMSYYLIKGYGRLSRAKHIDWPARMKWFDNPDRYLAEVEASIRRVSGGRLSFASIWPFGSRVVRRNLAILKDDRRVASSLVEHKAELLNPSALYHAVIIAIFNESLDILEPSVIALTKVEYPLSRLIMIIAYEERGGAEVEKNVHKMIAKYGDKFAVAQAVKHSVDVAGEIRGGGKGPNITHAGRALANIVAEKGIDPSRVIVTTFDSDHRASKEYFNYLSFIYAADPNRKHRSFQPIPMFYNNIWDAPAPMRVIATGNSFWTLMETMRPRRLRNFAAHAQSLDALIDTDFWSVTTIVEDGHQFWRSYFAFNGDHSVVPIYAPIYQDAVLADSYKKTVLAQYKQLRRWAWGASDITYVARNCFANRSIPWADKLVQFGRLFESHFSWATSSITLTAVAWLPLILNPQFSHLTLAHELPVITSRILQVASVGIVVTILVSIISLPPRPARYRRGRNILMVLQWALLPVTTIAFSSFAALDSQTRLLLGRHLEFYVTEKARKNK